MQGNIRIKKQKKFNGPSEGKGVVGLDSLDDSDLFDFCVFGVRDGPVQTSTV